MVRGRLGWGWGREPGQRGLGPGWRGVGFEATFFLCLTKNKRGNDHPFKLGLDICLGGRWCGGGVWGVGLEGLGEVGRVGGGHSLDEI